MVSFEFFSKNSWQNKRHPGDGRTIKFEEFSSQEKEENNAFNGFSSLGQQFVILPSLG